MNTYYVALGASAGGLEAITRFFQTMPSDTGCIFFIIQHLSPDYKSLMNELLQNDTDMQIETMSDGMPLLPNHIYIAPPRKLISLSQGCVRMQEIKENKNIPHSIDYFFHSLAREYGKQAIGIVLSGTGNDGASGIVTMKQAGARTIAQQTHSAAFDAMPRHAIATGCVDWILSPEEMASEILTYTLYPNDYQKISMLLLEYSDIDFRKYKENTLKRRIERRMEITECKTTNDYWKQLIDSEYEKKALLKELLIGVTDFFRDKEAYDSLVQSVIPYINFEKERVRIWSAGCSTGEEAYTLAILFLEYLEKKGISSNLQIFATDIDYDALECASKGYYPEAMTMNLSEDIRNKYFIKHGNGYRVCEAVRQSVIFARHDILKDPPFSKLDLLVCRNLFIYLKKEYQQNILLSFTRALNKGGFLFLGNSESVGEMEGVFERVDSNKIYRFQENSENVNGRTSDTRIAKNTDEFLLQSNETYDGIVDIFPVNEDINARIGSRSSLEQELTCTNEELIAANEELQSTNEELQSVNEELYSVNREYRMKIDELTSMTNDLQNLLHNTGIGAIYLDHNLCIRKLTPIAAEISGFSERDIGKTMDQTKGIAVYPELAEDAKHVLRTLEGIEKVVLVRQDFYWLVRLRPYRSEYNFVEGVIITMVDVSRLRREQGMIRTLETRLDDTMSIGNAAWWEYDVVTGHVEYSSRKATMLGYTVEEFPNYVYDICQFIHPEDFERAMNTMRDYILGNGEAWDIAYRMRCKDGSYIWFHDVGHVVEWTKEGKVKKIVGAVTRINEYVLNPLS